MLIAFRRIFATFHAMRDLAPDFAVCEPWSVGSSRSIGCPSRSAVGDPDRLWRGCSSAMVRPQSSQADRENWTFNAAFRAEVQSLVRVPAPLNPRAIPHRSCAHGPRVSRLKSLDGVQLPPPYTDHACRRSYSPWEPLETDRRASGSGRSSSQAIGTASRVVSVQGIGAPGA
jgi:hypothetical protein